MPSVLYMYHRSHAFRETHNFQVVPKESHEYNIIMEESYPTNVEEKHDRRSYVVKEEFMVKVILKPMECFDSLTSILN